MLATPGCWACDEMGALVAGVFWGYYHSKVSGVHVTATMKSTGGWEIVGIRSGGGVWPLVSDGLRHIDC